MAKQDKKYEYRFIDDDTVEFIINSPKHGEFKVLVDAEDWDRVGAVSWCIGVYTRGPSVQGVGSQSFAKFIMNDDRTDIIIHRKNPKTLDYRKSSLFLGGVMYDIKSVGGHMSGKFYSRAAGEIEILFDSDSLEKINEYRWSVMKNVRSTNPNSYYFVTTNKIGLRLHRHIVNCPDNMVVDHINNNPLDNRKCNLRIVTRTENKHNRPKQRNGTNKYIGVGKSSKSSYYARIGNGRSNHRLLGSFKTEEEAATVRDREVVRTRNIVNAEHQLNFPEKLEQYLEEIRKEKTNV